MYTPIHIERQRRRSIHGLCVRVNQNKNRDLGEDYRRFREDAVRPWEPPGAITTVRNRNDGKRERVAERITHTHTHKRVYCMCMYIMTQESR